MRYRWNEYHWPEYTVPTTARWIDEARCFSWRGPEVQGMRLTEEQIRSEWRGERDWKICTAIVRAFRQLAEGEEP